MVSLEGREAPLKTGVITCLIQGWAMSKRFSFLTRGAISFFITQPHPNYTLLKRLVKHLKSDRIGGMSKERYSGWALAVVAAIMVVVQMTFPQISPCVGWPIIALLSVCAIIFVMKGIKKSESVLGNTPEQASVLSLTAWGIGIAGYRDYPDKPAEAWLLRLWVVVSPSRPIATLDLFVGSEPIPIPAIDWTRKTEIAFTVHFDVSKWRYRSDIQVELVANKESGDTYTSGRKTIDFDMEPFGQHTFE